MSKETKRMEIVDIQIHLGIYNTQKTGPCYHSFGDRGQYTVNAGNSKWLTSR